MSFAPIFVVGCARSGTTLVRQILNAHSAIAIMPESSYVSVIVNQNRPFRLDNLLKKITSLPLLGEMGLSEDEFREKASGLASPDHGKLFRLMMEMYGKMHGASLVGEKTPNHLLHMDVLQSYFPDCKFIYIIRDPRAVVSSWRHVPWSTGSDLHSAGVWFRYERRGGELLKTIKNVYRIKYEALVAEPESQIKLICDFIGVAYEPGMLKFNESQQKMVNLDKEPWKKGISDEIQANSAEKWRTILTQREIAQIEAVTRQGMKRNGYRVETGRLSQLPGNAQNLLYRLNHGGRYRLNRWFRGAN